MESYHVKPINEGSETNELKNDALEKEKILLRDQSHDNLESEKDITLVEGIIQAYTKPLFGTLQVHTSYYYYYYYTYTFYYHYSILLSETQVVVPDYYIEVQQLNSMILTKENDISFWKSMLEDKLMLSDGMICTCMYVIMYVCMYV